MKQVVLLLLISCVFFILGVIFPNKKEYKYNFQAEIKKVTCDKFGMTENTYKDKSSTIQTSSTQQRQDIRCKMKLEYNQKDLGLSSKKKIFYITVSANEPYMEGETINIVSDTKNENDFRICCPFHMSIFTIIGTAFLLVSFIVISVIETPVTTGSLTKN